MRRNHLFTVSAFSFLIVALLLTIPLTTQAAPTDKDVRVINTTAEPVPTVAQGTTTIAGSVTVANTAAAPVPVANLSDAREPFQAATSLVQNGTNVSTLTVATVPAGKRLVIEFVSIHGQVPPTQHVELMEILTINGLGGVFHQLLVHAQPPAVIGDALFRAVQDLRLYADAGTEVRVLVRRNSSLGQATYGVTISGYLVNM